MVKTKAIGLECFNWRGRDGKGAVGSCEEFSLIIWVAMWPDFDM